MSMELISREAVLKLFATHDGKYLYEAIRDMPSTEQEPKTGHWIWSGGSHRCSNCNEYTCFAEKHTPKYCPNCGAKMENEG